MCCGDEIKKRMGVASSPFAGNPQQHGINVTGGIPPRIPNVSGTPFQAEEVMCPSCGCVFFDVLYKVKRLTRKPYTPFQANIICVPVFICSTCGNHMEVKTAVIYSEIRGSSPAETAAETPAPLFPGSPLKTIMIDVVTTKEEKISFTNSKGENTEEKE